ncbi:MAG: NUDIX domain-containing protein [Nanoarchaeota archaeon]|nr:NUDIX domain-containing protein [Nanoarchaeota archaeon]
MKSKKYRRGIFIVVYAVVKNKIEFLILRRKLHWNGWEFSKGGMRFYETQKMTVRREVKEETGLKILKMKKFRISGRYKYDKKYSDRKNFIGQTYGMLYAVKVKRGRVKIDKREHSNYKWINFSEAMKKLEWENQRRCLRFVNDWLMKINS